MRLILQCFRSSKAEVAIKIYEKYKLLDPQRRKSVWREIKLMERLSHPNVVKFIDAIDTPKQAILQTGHFVVARSRRKTQKSSKFFGIDSL